MKKFRLIAGVTALAVISAFAPQTAKAEEAKGFTPYLDLRASLAEVYTKEKAGETGYFGKGVKGSSTNFDNGDFISPLSHVGIKFTYDKITGDAQLWATSTPLEVYWAEYDAGVAKVLIGQLDPMYTLWTNQAAFGWDGLGGYGGAWSGREKQIKVSSHGFYLDLMPANRGTDYADDAYVQTLFPKTNIGYTTTFGDSMINVGGLVNYNKFQKKDDKIILSSAASLNDDGTVNPASATDTALGGKKLLSWMVYFTGKLVAGNLTVLATADYGINEGNAGMKDFNDVDAFRKAVAIDGKFYDTTTYEGGLEAMYNLGAFSLGAGAGYVHSDNSKWVDASIGYKGKDQNLMSAYVEGIIPVGKNVTLYPEVSYFTTLKDAKLNSAGEKTVWAGLFANYTM